MLTIENMHVSFKDQIALSIQTPIQINAGDRIGIIGSNGAGKSTLIKTLLGLLPFDGEIITTIPHQNMAVHLQENNYTNSTSVKLVMETILGTKISASPKVQELISYFQFEDCLKKRYNRLSGGQKQRLTIILVLMQDAEITFFDEVTSGLDFETRQQLMTKINDWYRNKDATICLVSHYYDELEALTNKLLLLEKGKVVCFGDKKSLFTKYCGHSTIIIQKEDDEATLFPEALRRLAAPKHLTAFSCANSTDEANIIAICNQHDINFKRSNNDIEIMTMNAKLQGGFSNEQN